MLAFFDFLFSMRNIGCGKKPQGENFRNSSVDYGKNSIENSKNYYQIQNYSAYSIYYAFMHINKILQKYTTKMQQKKHHQIMQPILFLQWEIV